MQMCAIQMPAMPMIDEIPCVRVRARRDGAAHILKFGALKLRRIPQVDGLRAVAILMVFAAHAFGVRLFWMGVDVFLVVSRVLITGILLRLKENRSAGKSYWASFYLRRIRRILPPYVAFLAVLNIFWRVPWGHIWYWYVFFAPNIPLALGKVVLAAMGPLWSLGVEEQFYFVWPWFVLGCSRDWLRRIALGVILISPILRAIATPLFSTHFPIYCLTIFRADALAMGAFIALAARRDPEWIARRRTTALTCCVSALALLIALSILPSFRAAANSILFNSLAYSLSAACLGGLLVYALGSQQGLLHKFLSAAPLRYLGLISYTFYLYHEAVLLEAGQYLHSRTLIALTAFSITVLISVLSWHLFEAPILGRSVRKQIADFRSRSDARFWPVETRLQGPIVVAQALSINDV